MTEANVNSSDSTKATFVYLSLLWHV